MKQIRIMFLAVILAATVFTTGKTVSKVKVPLRKLWGTHRKLDAIKMALEEHTNRDKGMCIASEPKGYEKNKENQEKTTLAMVKAQSYYFANLSVGPQQDAFINASRRNGYSMENHCPLETLIRCNADKDAINRCAANDTRSFIECLSPKCPDCTCAFASLLGLDCFGMRMVRLIRNSSEDMKEFGNILLTPYVDRTNDDIFKNRLYMNYEGVLVQDTEGDRLTKNFVKHKKYWDKKYGPIRSKKQAEALDTAKTVIETANSLVDVIEKTKTILLDDLKEQISQIKLDIDGITEQSRTRIQEALSALYKSEVAIARTRGLLESLAKETIHQVGSMIHYLDRVSDDWEAGKIAKFLRFQSKKMAELTDRSLDLIKKSDKLYEDVQLNLSEIKSKLQAFKIATGILLDSNSDAFKKRRDEIRKAIYIPCCLLTGGIGCALCIAGTEIEMNKWKGQLNKLQATITKNMAVTGHLLANVKETLSTLAKEVQSLIEWGAALTATARTDWEFEEAEIFGFADVRPQVVQTLENLKTAAKNYLANNFGKTN